MIYLKKEATTLVKGSELTVTHGNESLMDGSELRLRSHSLAVHAACLYDCTLHVMSLLFPSFNVSF